MISNISYEIGNNGKLGLGAAILLWVPNCGRVLNVVGSDKLIYAYECSLDDFSKLIKRHKIIMHKNMIKL